MNRLHQCCNVQLPRTYQSYYSSSPVASTFVLNYHGTLQSGKTFSWVCQWRTPAWAFDEDFSIEYHRDWTNVLPKAQYSRLSQDHDLGKHQNLWWERSLSNQDRSPINSVRYQQRSQQMARSCIHCINPSVIQVYFVSEILHPRNYQKVSKVLVLGLLSFSRNRNFLINMYKKL